jgi:hypothetical protein
MLRIIALVLVLVSSVVVGGGAFAQDRDMTRDQDKAILHDQDMIKDQDKLQTGNQDKTTDPDKDMIRDRDRDRLDQPGDAGMNQGSGRGTGSSGGRK